MRPGGSTGAASGLGTTVVMRAIGTRARRGGDTGAAAVEFAILLPLFLVLVFGLITGGIAFERWINVTQGAREASRFGATYSFQAAGSTDAWYTAVLDAAAENSGIRLTGPDPTPTGDYFICVAFRRGTEPATLLPESGISTLGTFRTAGSDCTGSTMPDSRVEVLVVRRATFDWLLGGGTVPVTGDNTSRYEGPRTS